MAPAQLLHVCLQLLHPPSAQSRSRCPRSHQRGLQRLHISIETPNEHISTHTKMFLQYPKSKTWMRKPHFQTLAQQSSCGVGLGDATPSIQTPATPPWKSPSWRYEQQGAVEQWEHRSRHVVSRLTNTGGTVSKGAQSAREHSQQRQFARKELRDLSVAAFQRQNTYRGQSWTMEKIGNLWLE